MVRAARFRQVSPGAPAERLGRHRRRTAQSPSAADTALINAIAGTTYVRRWHLAHHELDAGGDSRTGHRSSIGGDGSYVEGSSAWPSESVPARGLSGRRMCCSHRSPAASARSAHRKRLGSDATDARAARAMRRCPSVATAALPARRSRRAGPRRRRIPAGSSSAASTNGRRAGRLRPPVVSEPTEVFQLAGFFDPDAPARPIRIGCRSTRRRPACASSTRTPAFMMSDMLCGQMERVKGLTLGDLVLSVLPWPFHKPLPSPEQAPCPTTDWMLLALASRSSRSAR